MSEYPHQLTPLQRWLLTAGRQRLAGYPEQAERDLTADQRAAVEQQLSWRRRSRGRFPDPNLWLWSDRSLSQASDWLSALFKATLFPRDELVVDGCCGAGVDAVALLRRGPVLAIDSDPWMTALACSNAAAHGGQLQVRTEPFTAASLRGADWLHVDPDRRSRSARLRRAEEFSPSLAELLEIATATRAAVIKLPPSTIFSADLLQQLAEGWSRVWLGSGGQTRQLLLVSGRARLSGGLGQPGISGLTDSVATAIILRPDGGEVGFALSAFSQQPRPAADAVVPQPDAYLYDLDSTLHASGLQAAWAAQHGLQALSASHGFYTGPTQQCTPWSQTFRVLDVLAWDDKRVRKWLRLPGGPVEIKSRLVPVDAAAYQRRYQTETGRAVTCWSPASGACSPIAAER